MESKRETIGIISATMAQLREAGRREYCRAGTSDDTVLASVMSTNELKKYYKNQVDGLKKAVETLSEIPGLEAKIGSTVDVFRADLGVLKERGIDVGEANRLFEAWNGA